MQPEAVALARIVAVSVGRAQTHQTPAGFVRAGEAPRKYRSAIVKSPVFGPAFIATTGVAGDQQADTRHHGGPDKGVHAHFAQHLQWWGQRRGRQLLPGQIGDNLTLGTPTEGAAEPEESAFCIGDVLRVGKAFLQVSQPRIPCFKQARQLGLPDGVTLAVAAGRTGMYLRVLREGDVRAGDLLLLLARPHPWATVAECNRLLHHARRDAGARERLAALPELAASVWEALQG